MTKPDETAHASPGLVLGDQAPKTSEIIRTTDDLSAFSLSNPPPLPEHAFRLRLRAALQTYRHRTTRGWRRIAKQDLWRTVTKEEASDRGNASALDPESIARRLTYWCAEGGDLKDPKLIYLVMRFLKLFAPHDWALLMAHETILHAGQHFASFFDNHEPPIAFHHGILRMQGRPSLQPEHLTADIATTATSYFVFENTETKTGSTPKPDIQHFLLCQLLTLDWTENPQAPLIHERLSGFYFPRADPGAILLRDCSTRSHRYYIARINVQNTPAIGFLWPASDKDIHLKRELLENDLSEAQNIVIQRIASQTKWDG